MAFCANCGAELSDQAPVCPKCGHPRAAVQTRRTEGTAIAALILGILGLVGCPLIPSIAAVILGNQARAKIRSDPTLDGDGMARAGMILGWIGIGLAGLAILGMIIALIAGVTLGGSGFDDSILDASGILAR